MKASYPRIRKFPSVFASLAGASDPRKDGPQLWEKKVVIR